MFYLVKHTSEDYRLHESDGTKIGSWESKPSTSEMASKLNDGWRIVTERFCYRDLTTDGEGVPF